LLIHSIYFAFIKLGVLTCYFDFVTTLYSILIVCIISAYLYKLALFPFHFILPYVYSGISLATIGLLNVGVKLPIGLHLFYLWNIHFVHPLWVNVTSSFLIFSWLLSVVVVCMVALTQGSLKRFMGYASINQMCFMVLVLSCTSFIVLSASILYLLIYIWSLLLFSTILLRANIPSKYLTYLVFGDDVDKSLLALVIFSMAGLPPFIVFISKYFIWLSLMDNFLFSYTSSTVSLYGIFVLLTMLVTMVTSIISTFYYLRFIKIMWFMPSRRVLHTRPFRDAVYAHGPMASLVCFTLLAWPLFIGRLADFCHSLNFYSCGSTIFH